MTLHGSYGREYATGRGVVLATRELLRYEHMGKIAGKTFVIQVQAPLSFNSLLLAIEVCHSLRRCNPACCQLVSPAALSEVR